jgi:hypothetical protein
LGAMDDEAVDEDDEVDALLTLSGSRKCFLLPGMPKMSWYNTATYGTIGPLWFGKGEERVAQRAESVEQHISDDTSSFYPGLGRRKA